MKNYFSEKVDIKTRVSAIGWAFRLAWRFGKAALILWLSVSVALAVLPALALYFNKEIIAKLSAFLSTGGGGYSDIAGTIVIYGVIFTLIGLSSRVNEALIYMMLYDRYYFGMEGMMMDAVQRMPMKYLLKKEVRDEQNAVVNREGSLTDFMSGLCVLIGKLVSVISLLVLAYTVSHPAFYLSLAYVISTFATNFFYAEKQRYNSRVIKKDERTAAYYERIVAEPGPAKEIRVFSATERIKEKWRAAYGNVFNYNLKRKIAGETGALVSGLIFYGFMAGILILSLYAVSNRALAPDGFLMLYTMCANILASVSGMASTIRAMDYGVIWLERQYAFFNSAPQADESAEAGLEFAPDDGSEYAYEARDIHFSYAEGKEVLRGVTFKIRKGESIALVGGNGSGKTTLTKLLLRLYHPDSGELYLFGKPIASYRADFIRKSIGAFFQKFTLFHVTAGENIGFGDIRYVGDEDKLTLAAKKGGVYKLISGFKAGLSQLIGRNVYKHGVMLSGGEGQRLAVSRAHMNDKPVMIFDEPASALDPIAEMEQFRSIQERIKGRTSILISHRVGFARMADRILVMSDGVIAEDGTHDELMARGGIYARFFTEQAKWYDTGAANKGGTHE